MLHNAGVLVDERRRTAQGHELTVATHVLGPLLLTGLLAPELRAAVPSRVVFVSSGGMYTARAARPTTSSSSDEEFDGPRFYAHAKRLQVIVAEQLAERWRATGSPSTRCTPGGCAPAGSTRHCRGSPGWPARCSATRGRAPTRPSGCSRRPRPHRARAASGTTACRAPLHRLPWTRETDVGAAGGLGRARPAQRLRRSGGASASRSAWTPDEPGRGRRRRGLGPGRRARARPRRTRDHRVRGRRARPAGTPTRSPVETPGGTWDVDTGFIVFNDRNYPNFERLLDELGVAPQPAEMSLSVSDGRGGFEWSSRCPRRLRAPRSPRRPALSPDDRRPGALLSRGPRPASAQTAPAPRWASSSTAGATRAGSSNAC